MSSTDQRARPPPQRHALTPQGHYETFRNYRLSYAKKWPSCHLGRADFKGYEADQPSHPRSLQHNFSYLHGRAHHEAEEIPTHNHRSSQTHENIQRDFINSGTDELIAATKIEKDFRNFAANKKRDGTQLTSQSVIKTQCHYVPSQQQD